MKLPNRYFYPAVLTFETGHEIAVVFPDLGIATSGTDERDALLSARELLEVALWGMEQDGEEIPAPSSVANVPLEENERAILVDVYMPSVRMANANKAAMRTATIPARSDTGAVEHGVDFPQALREAPDDWMLA